MVCETLCDTYYINYFIFPHETFTIGPEKGKTYNSKHGYPCKAEQGIDDVKHNVKYLPLFHHFKAIYQFPKHIIFLVKIITA
jgi:hypothetical protein